MSPQDLDSLEVEVDELTAEGFEMGQLWELLDRNLPYVGSVSTPKMIRNANQHMARIIAARKGYEMRVFTDIDGYLEVSFVQRTSR